MKVENHVLIGDQGEPVSHIITNNHSSPMSPLYLIVHYTAGVSIDGAVNWFLDPVSRASAHIVIGMDGKIVQMVPFNKRAWHAGKSTWGNLTGLNSYSIGIELVNAGKLMQRSDGNWMTWSKQIIPPDQVTIAQHKDESISVGWHEYTEEQLQAAIQVGIVLCNTYEFIDVLGHDDISPHRKTDPGPLFPMNSYRSMVMGRI